MKNLFALVLVAFSLTVSAQKNKAPKMAPVLAEGYYVGTKGDTVRGMVQTNPEFEVDMYKQFSFKPDKGGKVMPVNPKRATAYGYDGKHFILYNYGGEDVYIERLTSGRLNFFEYRLNGKVDGYTAVVSEYFAQDNRAEGEDIKLKELTKISNKFYKKDLKPFMKDQLMIWTDLDKFTFEKQTVVNAIIEFNKYYIISAN